MGWFKKSQPVQPAKGRDFKAEFWTADDFPDNPTLTPIRTRIEQLASSGDESALRKAISELGVIERFTAPLCLGLPPITSTKVATLSLLMFDSDPTFANSACNGLWQLLLSDAKPDQLALLKQIASPTGSHANYDVAHELVSTLMTSSLGRNLKAGEMENVTRLIRAQLGLSPEKLLH